MSPTARTLKWIRDAGYHAQVVETWVPQTSQRRDLFGVIDIVAVDGTTTLGIQATSTANVAARVQKCLSHDGAKQWLACPTRQLWVVGWRRYAHPLDGRWWRPTIRRIARSDLALAPTAQGEQG
jgi:hypothetical protein